MFDSLLQALRLDRLEQVVDGAGFERAQRMLVVGGDEHDGRTQAFRQLRDQREAVALGHFDVEENQVGCVFVHQFHGIGHVRSGADHLDVGDCTEQSPQAVAGEFDIVDDQATQGRGHAISGGGEGRRTRTSKPPAARAWACNSALPA